MFNPKTDYGKITTKLSLTGTAGTIELSVSAFRLRLTAGGLPTIIFTLDPKHNPGDTDRKPGRPSLSEMQAWVERVSKYANDPSSYGNFEVKITNMVGEVTQELKLNNWLVVATGLDGIQGSGGFVLSLTLQHPTAKLDRHAGSVGDVNDVTLNLSQEVKEAVDIVDCLSKYAIAYANANRETGDDVTPAIEGLQNSMTAAEAKDACVANLREGGTELPELVKWNGAPMGVFGYGSGFPTCGGTLSGEEHQRIKMGIAAGLTLRDSVSLWTILNDNLCTDLGMTTIPTYWKPYLAVMPFTPWGPNMLTLYDDQVAELNLPGVQPSPLGGVKITTSGVTPEPGSSFMANYTSAPEKKTLREYVYVPKGNDEQPRKLLGKLAVHSTPDWFLGLCTNFGGNISGFLHNPSSTTTVKDAAELSDTKHFESQEKYGSALYTWAAHVYLSLFMQNRELAILTPLMFTNDNSSTENYVIPGVRMTLKSKTDDSTILDCYIKSVVHSVDVARATASTQFVCTYHAPPAGYPGIVNIPTRNPLYT